MPKWLVQFPQAREAPSEIRSALRHLDDTAEVVYLGPRQWIVGKVRPTTDSVRIAGEMLKHAADIRVVAARDALSRRQRVAFALLGVQGFRPVAAYALNDLDARVVTEFRESQWRMQHWSDADLFRDLDAHDALRKQHAQREMTDTGRAADAHRVAFSSNFGRAVPSVTNTDVDTRSSARTRVLTLAS